MSFKLIAIRPIKKCDSGLLKGLVTNCIYQFYNEYDFYYKQNNESIELQSYIEYQKLNLIDNNKKKHIALEYKPIDAIKKNEIVPHGLFGTNINVSAIVGQNGSGKSSILELYYYLMYKYATKHNLVINKKDLKSNKKLEVEIFFEDENRNVVIHHYSEQEDYLRKYDLKKEEFYYLSNDKYSDLFSYQCYSIALNYSIYGLNSNVSGNWLDSLFHKNDGYRTPIVINPYREDGNIDINNEYILAQSRLLLSYYLINKKSLLEDVQISTVKFILEILKHQFITEYEEETGQNIRIPISKIYNLLISYNPLIYSNLTRDRELNLLVKKILEEEILINYEKDHFIFKNSNDSTSKEFKNILKSINNKYIEFKVLNSFYVLKKIYKITQNYKEYEVFKQIFDIKHNEIISYKTIDISKIEIIKIYSDYFYRILKNLFEEYFKEKNKEYVDLSLISKNEKLKLIDYLKKIDYRIFKKFKIQSSDNFHGYFDIILNGYIDIIENGYLDTINRVIKYKDLISFILNSVINNILSKEVIDLKDNIYSSVDYIFSRDKSDKNFQLGINEMNNLLFLKLYSDESHITFKLKQAISYFEEGFFENIKDYVWDDVLEQFNIELNKNYLEHRSIKTMPLAFVQPMVMVVKTEETNEQIIEKLINNSELSEYPFNELSSGEQQLIHSILTIVYHIYNLKSIEGLHKQTNINLIFDEIELYFHPEYQRKYVSNLIMALKGIDKKGELKFNVLLSTHSPFILSDIPSQNVLKLEEGRPKSNDNVNSFAANIYDLLKDDFFLKKGAIGAFASEKIKNILVADKIDHEDMDIINLIGDPFLKGVIKKQIEANIADEVIEKEIERLKEIQQKRSKNAKNKGI